MISTTSTTYGSLAAALILGSPLIVIPAIRATLLRKKSENAQPIDNVQPKKKRKAHRGRRHSKKIAEKAKAKMVLEVMKAAEEQEMSFEMAMQLAMRSQMEMSMAHDARKESKRQKGQEKSTKGSPASKTQAGWRQTEKGEEIGEVGMDGAVGREEVDGDNWTEVVSKKRRKNMAVTPSLSEAATLTETAVSEEASLSEETAVSEEEGLSEKPAVVMEADMSKKAAVSEEVWFE
jgi:hypothetical protein